MLAYTLAKRAAERFDAVYPVPERVDLNPRTVVTERAVYQSRRLSPASAIAAITLAAAAFSSFQYLECITPYKLERRLTVVDLANLVTSPPPPPAEKLAVKQADAPLHVPSPIVAPTPIVVTPTPAPILAVADVASPPAPAVASDKAPDHRIVDVGLPAPSATTTEAGDLSSKMISATPPSYPLESRRLREQGTVTLAVLLSVEGRVERLSVAKSSGYPRLDRAASGAVRHWRWSPTVLDGQPVLVQGNVIIPFVLRG